MRTILVPVFAALACAAAPAVAKEYEPVQISVSYADIDLADPADMAKLESRIETAARKACTRTSRSTLVKSAIDTRCAEELETAALEQVELIKSQNLAFAD